MALGQLPLEFSAGPQHAYICPATTRNAASSLGSSCFALMIQTYAVKEFYLLTYHGGVKRRSRTPISLKLHKMHIKLSELFPWSPTHLTWGGREALYSPPPSGRKSKCHSIPTMIHSLKLSLHALCNTPTLSPTIATTEGRDGLLLAKSYYNLLICLTKVSRTLL